MLDTCGTGGDGLGTFNISSLAAVVAASCGALVAKHGNRGASSPVGSADFFRELGVAGGRRRRGELRSCCGRRGSASSSRPTYHGAMRHAARARSELGIRSAMNLVGPLSNPADASYQLIGVFDGAALRPDGRGGAPAGRAPGHGGARGGRPGRDLRLRAHHGRGGRRDGSAQRLLPDPGGVRHLAATPWSSCGAERRRRTPSRRWTLLAGEGPAAIREAVLLNAGAALYICGIARNIGEGYLRAREALQSGRGRGEAGADPRALAAEAEAA